MKGQSLASLLLVVALPLFAQALPSKKTVNAEPKKQKLLIQPVAQHSFFEPKTEERISELASSIQEDLEAPISEIEMAN